jgi:hypothetical protein
VVVNVKVELAPAVTDVGLKLDVAPLGSPDVLRATDSAAPPVIAVLIVEVPV